jgi:hypothetical protein
MSLSDQQLALVKSLVCGGPAPPGFDVDKVASARRVLVQKRSRAVAKTWPSLMVMLSENF